MIPARRARQRRDLGAVPIAADAPFLIDFPESHLADIHDFQPDFRAAQPDSFALMLTRDGLPAGALPGVRQGTDLHRRCLALVGSPPPATTWCELSTEPRCGCAAAARVRSDRSNALSEAPK